MSFTAIFPSIGYGLHNQSFCDHSSYHDNQTETRIYASSEASHGNWSCYAYTPAPK